MKDSRMLSIYIIFGKNWEIKKANQPFAFETSYE